MKFKCPKCGCLDCWQELQGYANGSITYLHSGYVDEQIGELETEVPDEEKNIYRCNNCDEAVTIEDEERTNHEQKKHSANCDE